MQTSAHNLNHQASKILYQQLLTLLLDFDKLQDLTEFMNDFFTETEMLVFAKRLGILWMLNQGKSYQEIKDQLKVSSATISTMAEMKDKKGILLAIEKIKADQKIEQQASNLAQILKKLHLN